MKKYFVLFLFFSIVGFSQSLSQYKYVIVPAKFDAQKKAGQFGLNNLTKLFLEKNGYTVFYDTDILPLEVSGENCNKAYINVFDDNSIRTTRLRVEIKDCRNAVLFVSGYGESSDKDNRVAYNLALRSAFRSFDTPEYRYNPDTPVSQSKPIETAAPKPVEAAMPKPEKAAEAVAPAVQKTELAAHADRLNAQPIANGYQLVDHTPKIVLKIYVTSDPDVFIGENDDVKGVVLKKGGQWFFEYYQQKVLVVKPLNITF